MYVMLEVEFQVMKWGLKQIWIIYKAEYIIWKMMQTSGRFKTSKYVAIKKVISNKISNVDEKNNTVNGKLRSGMWSVHSLVCSPYNNIRTEGNIVGYSEIMKTITKENGLASLLFPTRRCNFLLDLLLSRRMTFAWSSLPFWAQQFVEYAR